LNQKQLAKKFNTDHALKETRQQLARWGRVELLCKNANEEMEAYQERTKEVARLIHNAGVKVAGGMMSDPTPGAVEHLERTRASYEHIVTSCANEVESATKFKLTMDALMAELLTPDDILMFKLHYNHGDSWTMIALRMSISVDGIYKRERQAVEALSKRICVSKKSTV